MSQSTDILLFDELMRLPKEFRRAIMHKEFPDGGFHPRHRMGQPMEGPHGPGNPPFPMPPHHGHGNRPFAREKVMQTLLEYEDGARQKDLAEKLHVNPSSMSELIEKLQSDGYIERTIDPEDRRATRITLSELGKARAYEISDERAERIKPLFANLTEEEKEELLRLVRKLNMPKPEE